MKKKLLILILTLTFSFLIGANIYLNASSDWTLDDGYYYYNKDIKFDNEPVLIESLNGNPLEIKKENSPIWRTISYSSKIKAEYLEDRPGYWTEHATLFHWDDREEFKDQPGYRDSFTLLFDFSDLIEQINDESDIVPISIRYRATAYNKSSPGDLSLPDYTTYNIIQITSEEYNASPTHAQRTMPIYHDYATVETTDRNFIKYLLKHHYYEDFSYIPGFDITTSVYKVIKPSFILPGINPEPLDVVYYKITTASINQIYDLNALPITASTFRNRDDQLADVFIDKKGPNIYDLQVTFQGQVYEITIDNIPEQIAESRKVYYFTDKNNRYLVGFFNSANGWIETDSFNENLKENAWIFWNINEGDFKASMLNTVHVKIHNEKKGISYYNQLYADVVIPHKIDDLISISVKYKYQYVYLMGGPGQEVQVNEQILLKDERSDFELPWYNSLFGFYNWAIKQTSWVRDQLAVDHIEKLEVDNQYKLDLVDWYNDQSIKHNLNKTYSVGDIFPLNHNVYQLFLGNFNKTFSTGLNVKDFGILSYRFEVDGVEYTNAFPKVDAPDYEDERAVNITDPIIKFFKDLLAKLWAFVLKSSWIAIPVIGILTFPFVDKFALIITGKKRLKRRGLVIIGWIGLLLLTWFTITKGF